MNRRNFLKYSTAALASNAIMSNVTWAADPGYTGEFLLQVQVFAGWDVASFCDPKQDADINTWAATDTIKTAGNIKYAPFANNGPLFENHHDKMLVVNGVNSFTNSHSAGRLYSFTGFNGGGYPSLSALFAAEKGARVPIPVIFNGGDFFTQGIVAASKLGNNATPFLQILENEKPTNNNKPFLKQEQYSLIQQFNQRRSNNQLGVENTLPKEKIALADYDKSIQPSAAFSNFKPLLTQVEAKETTPHANGRSYNYENKVLKQAKFSLLAFASGLSVSADIVATGFDSHSDHDNKQAIAMSDLASTLDYIWVLAEELGIADRLNVYVASDFGRTPFYNNNLGKDHWAVGSNLIMKKNAPWAGKVVGSTDANLNAQKVNRAAPSTSHDANGVMLEPKHVMQAMRKQLGIDQSPVATAFPLKIDAGDEVDIFGLG
ncbi:DUF1501 domain-containing protein [Thalassomonas sp. M1454]|uniref:DUF1501 domain-containing protein n=1 Tax=Thalassomonas sp. M1454 TaxID=2594477 RepID=UPI00163D6F1E|nr:DUF1501 domain-containing protein [Thalassomonas sp. M1454]